MSVFNLHEVLPAYSGGQCKSSRRTPICSTLPPELLSLIFHHYLKLSSPYDPEKGESLGQRVLAEHLLLVCRSWRDAAMGDSSLWREIILDPEIARVTPYKSLDSYIKIRSIRSRAQLLHVSINNDRDQVGRLPYLKAYCHLVGTMSRWERLFYYLKRYDAHSCISIYHLASPTPNLREVVIRAPTPALGLDLSEALPSVDLSQTLPETPNLKLLEISVPGIDSLPPLFGKSVTIASIQIVRIEAWRNALSQLENMHTLILQPPHTMTVWYRSAGMPLLNLPSVRTVILVGPLFAWNFRVRGLQFPALQTFEIDLSASGAEKQWSKARAGRFRLKSLLEAGLQELILKGIWFDRLEDIVEILQDANGSVGEVVCIDVTCTLQNGEGHKVEIDLTAILMQSAVSSASPSAILRSLREIHGIEWSN